MIQITRIGRPNLLSCAEAMIAETSAFNSGVKKENVVHHTRFSDVNIGMWELQPFKIKPMFCSALRVNACVGINTGGC